MGIKHRYLWLGSYQSDEQFKRMLARNIGQASGYTSQKGLIRGFDKILDKDSELDTIGVISYPSYPVYPKVRANKQIWSRTGSSYDMIIGYCTLKIVTYFSRRINLMKSVKQWCKYRAGKENTTVIVYEPSVSKLNAALYIRKVTNAKIYVIIPDIPELVNLGAGRIKKIGKRYAAMEMKKLFAYVDGFVLYSEHMAEYYGLSDDKWILMEGVFDDSEARFDSIEKNNSTIKKLMYCGALDEYRGIPQLLNAFSKLDKNYELWLCGAGRSDNLIHEMAKKDPRIKHFGYLDSREDVLDLERQADILIHTRDVNSPAAPYCFPSKLFEYMVTGKPVLSVDIPGIPREYFRYLIKIDDLSEKGIYNALMHVKNMDNEEIQKRGDAEREYVLNNKNSKCQAAKIIRFMERQ